MLSYEAEFKPYKIYILGVNVREELAELYKFLVICTKKY